MTRFLCSTTKITVGRTVMALAFLLVAAVSVADIPMDTVPLPYSVTVSGPQSVLPGDTAEYTFLVTNGSPIPLENLILRVQWYQVRFESNSEYHPVIGAAVEEPAKFTGFVAGSKGVVPHEDGSLQWSLPILQPQETKSYRLQCCITGDFPPLLSLIATVKLDTPDAKFANFAIIVQRDTTATSSWRIETPAEKSPSENSPATNVPFEQSLIDTPPVAKPPAEIRHDEYVPQVGSTLAAIAKIPTPERRILAALKLASLETELFGLAAAEKTFDMILATVKEVQSFEVRMEIICAVAEIYRAATESVEE